MIIEYGNTVINLDKLIYGLVSKYDAGYEVLWKFSLHFEGGKELTWSGLKTEDEAKSKKAAFVNYIQKHMYVIPELP